jgi:hypothetical protein
MHRCSILPNRPPAPGIIADAGETKSLLSSRLGTIRHRVHEAANFGKHNEANESPIDRGPGRCNLPLA